MTPAASAESGLEKDLDATVPAVESLHLSTVNRVEAEMRLGRVICCVAAVNSSRALSPPRHPATFAAPEASMAAMKGR